MEPHCKTVDLWTPGPHSIAQTALHLRETLHTRIGSNNVPHLMPAFNARIQLFVLSARSSFQGPPSTPLRVVGSKKEPGTANR